MLNRVAIAMFLLVCAISCNSCSKQGREEILGRWLNTSGQFLGKDLPKESAGSMRITFTKDKLTWEFLMPPGNTWKSSDGTYKLDASRQPKEIDLSEPNNPKRIAGHLQDPWRHLDDLNGG